MIPLSDGLQQFTCSCLGSVAIMHERYSLLNSCLFFFSKISQNQISAMCWFKRQWRSIFNTLCIHCLIKKGCCHSWVACALNKQNLSPLNVQNRDFPSVNWRSQHFFSTSPQGKLSILSELIYQLPVSFVRRMSNHELLTENGYPAISGFESIPSPLYWHFFNFGIAVALFEVLWLVT